MPRRSAPNRHAERALLDLVHLQREAFGSLAARTLLSAGLYDLWWLYRRRAPIDALTSQPWLGGHRFFLYAGLAGASVLALGAGALTQSPALAGLGSAMAVGACVQRARLGLAMRRAIVAQVKSPGFAMSPWLTALLPLLYTQSQLNGLKVVKVKQPPPGRAPVRVVPDLTYKAHGFKAMLAASVLGLGLLAAGGALGGYPSVASTRPVEPAAAPSPTPILPADPKARLAYARALLDGFQGDTAKLLRARQVLAQLVTQQPRDAVALTQFARATYLQGTHAPATLHTALGLLEQALAIDPKLPEAHLHRGWVRHHQQRADKVAEAIARLDQLKPHWDETRFLEAQQALSEGRRPDAVVVAMQRIANQPQSAGSVAKAHARMIAAYRLMKRWSEAEAGYRKLLALQPEAAATRVEYAGFLAQRQRWDEAIAMAKQGLAATDVEAGHQVLARAYAGKAYEVFWKEERHDEGARLYELSLKEDPAGDAIVWYTLGYHHLRVAYDQRDTALLKQSEAEIRQSLALQPGFKDAQDKLDYIIGLKRHLRI